MNNKSPEWLAALYIMTKKEYWTKANTVEFVAFIVKALIIVPGLIFNYQIWWFYIIAVLSSFMLVWSSTIKTIPTLIWFNILWIVLGTVAITKYWIM